AATSAPAPVPAAAVVATAPVEKAAAVDAPAAVKTAAAVDSAAANAALGEAHIGGKQHQTKRYAKAGAHRSKTQKSAHGSPGSRRGKMTVQPAQSPEDRPVLPPLPSGSRSC